MFSHLAPAETRWAQSGDHDCPLLWCHGLLVPKEKSSSVTSKHFYATHPQSVKVIRHGPPFQEQSEFTTEQQAMNASMEGFKGSMVKYSFCRGKLQKLFS